MKYLRDFSVETRLWETCRSMSIPDIEDTLEFYGYPRGQQVMFNDYFVDDRDLITVLETCLTDKERDCNNLKNLDKQYNEDSNSPLHHDNRWCSCKRNGYS